MGARAPCEQPFVPGGFLLASLVNGSAKRTFLAIADSSVDVDPVRQKSLGSPMNKFAEFCYRPSRCDVL